MSVTAIIQARMGSTRLPGKSLMDLAGKPVIHHLVDRARAARSIDRVVVATTTAASDDPLAAFLAGLGVDVFRGSETDVLDRYAGAARRFGGDLVVRLTGDDPLKDPAVIDQVVGRLLAEPARWDYVSNTIRPTFPEGQDTEAFPAARLFEAAAEAADPYEREHVTPFFYRHPERFRVLNVTHEPDLSFHRWTLDTEADLAFFRTVLAELDGADRMVAMPEVLALIARRPDIAEINRQVARSAQYQGNNP